MAFLASSGLTYSTSALPVCLPSLSHLIPHLFKGPISPNKIFYCIYRITFKSLLPVSGLSPVTIRRVFLPIRGAGPGLRLNVYHILESEQGHNKFQRIKRQPNIYHWLLFLTLDLLSPTLNSTYITSRSSRI